MADIAINSIVAIYGAGGGGVSLVPNVYNQIAPSSIWLITHNLGYKPSNITLLDSGSNVWSGDIQHVDTNNFTVTFTASFSGTVLYK